ncbi:MAG: GNAT family N-acetyltransferase [Bacillota bacterium]
MRACEVRRATANDVAEVARVFRDCFPDSIERLFPGSPPAWVVESLMGFVIEAEPGCCSVALDRNGEIAGYCMAVASMPRMWLRAPLSGRMWALLGAVLTGKIRIGLRGMGMVLRDKAAFIASFRSFLRRGTGQILSVGVSPAARGRGVGERLVRSGLSHLRSSGVRAVKLEVRPDNEAAMRLYCRVGFVRVATTRDTWGPWLVMSMELDGQ